MKTITIHRAKTHLSRLIEEACQGEEIITAKGDKPKVRLVPITEPNGNRKPGRLKGKFKLGPEFFEPLPPEELDLGGSNRCAFCSRSGGSPEIPLDQSPLGDESPSPRRLYSSAPFLPGKSQSNSVWDAFHPPVIS